MGDATTTATLKISVSCIIGHVTGPIQKASLLWCLSVAVRAVLSRSICILNKLQYSIITFLFVTIAHIGFLSTGLSFSTLASSFCRFSHLHPSPSPGVWHPIISLYEYQHPSQPPNSFIGDKMFFPMTRTFLRGKLKNCPLNSASLSGA